MTAASPAVHATAVVLGGDGVLVRGPSGSGKSALAALLIDRRRRIGRFAALVADDRVHLEVVGGRLIARAPAPIAGLIEVRGLGVVAVDHEPASVVRLAVDLVPHGEMVRMPDPAMRRTSLLGVDLARLSVPSGDAAVAAMLVEAALALH